MHSLTLVSTLTLASTSLQRGRNRGSRHSFRMRDAVIKIPVVLLVVCLLCVRAASVLDLSLGQWELSNRNRSIVLPVQLPGYALQHLHEHRLIADSLHG